MHHNHPALEAISVPVHTGRQLVVHFCKSYELRHNPPRGTANIMVELVGDEHVTDT